MRNKEYTNEVLRLMLQRKTNKQIALETRRHRNTVSKYVNYIRKELVQSPEETVNKIDRRLNDELDILEPRDLISYRRELKPRKIEIKSEHKEEITKKLSIDINRYTEDERNTIRKVLRTSSERMDPARPDSIH